MYLSIGHFRGVLDLHSELLVLEFGLDWLL